MFLKVLSYSLQQTLAEHNHNSMTSGFESCEDTRGRNLATKESQAWREPRRAKPLWEPPASGRSRCLRFPPSPSGAPCSQSRGQSLFQPNPATVSLGHRNVTQEEQGPPCRQVEALGDLNDLCILLKTPNISLAAKTDDIQIPPPTPPRPPPFSFFLSFFLTHI